MALMFKLLTPVVCAVPLLFSACAGDRDRFVKPVAAPIAPDRVSGLQSRFEDAYLRIFVSSNLDDSGKLIDFGKQNDRPAMMLISARFGKGTVASFANDADPEIPVLLYDIQAGKTLSSVVDNALLTEGVLVDPESLSKSPHLQIFVRGVAADKAKWVTNLLEVATAEPMLRVGMSFIPGATAFSPLSTKLGDMLSDEIKTTNKPWEEKTLLGLRADQGLAALDGRQFVVLLNSTTMAPEPPPVLSPCTDEASPTGLCDASGAPWKPDRAYVRFELDVTDFRSIKDFIGSGLSCEANARDWSDLRELLASGQLARRQTQNERQILARGELLVRIRREQAEMSQREYPARLLRHAQQFALLERPRTAYWEAHFAERSDQLDQCIREAAVRGQTQYAAIWDSTLKRIDQAQNYPNWAATLARKPGASALGHAEAELRAVKRLLRSGALERLDANSLQSLTGMQNQLEQLLEPAYEQLGAKLLDDQDLPLPKRITRIEKLASKTACARCKQSLLSDAEELRAELEPPEPEEIEEIEEDMEAVRDAAEVTQGEAAADAASSPENATASAEAEVEADTAPAQKPLQAAEASDDAKPTESSASVPSVSAEDQESQQLPSASEEAGQTGEESADDPIE
ncbi:MAG: hypothetical protein ACPGZP_04675 [Panacagrimonas sp.]